MRANFYAAQCRESRGWRILRTAVWLSVTTIVEDVTASIIVEMNHSDDLWLNYTILTMMGPYYYKREMSASSLSMTFDTTDDIR